jgi:hypothetical protein
MIQPALCLQQGFLVMTISVLPHTMAYFLIAKKNCPANTMLFMGMEARLLDTL